MFNRLFSIYLTVDSESSVITGEQDCIVITTIAYAFDNYPAGEYELPEIKMRSRVSPLVNYGWILLVGSASKSPTLSLWFLLVMSYEIEFYPLILLFYKRWDLYLITDEFDHSIENFFG